MTRLESPPPVGVSALAIVPRVMNIDEVAEHCGVKRRTVERWITAGEIPAHGKPGGRGFYFLADELTMWLRNRCSDSDTTQPAGGAA